MTFKDFCTFERTWLKRSELSLRFSHTIFILIQDAQASRWLIFCQPVLLKLFRYGNKYDKGYDKHLRSRTERITTVTAVVRYCIPQSLGMSKMSLVYAVFRVEFKSQS